MDDIKQELLESLGSKDKLQTWNCYEPKYFGPDSRTLPLFGEVENDQTLLLISQIKHLEEIDPEKPISIYLNTVGGSLTDGLAIYDAVTQASCPVLIRATGLCASVGLLILNAADYRMATPSTTFYYHQPLIEGSSVNSIQDMDSLKEYYASCKSIADDIVRKRSKIKKPVWKKNFGNRTSFYFDTKTALSFNLIDEITQSNKVDFYIEG
jgi:ATP-dependent Clp protease protease subunit